MFNIIKADHVGHEEFLIQMNVFYRRFLWGLILIFVSYNAMIYTQKGGQEPLSQEALAGAFLWQEYNCVACHQIYGLGGYVGPDLTNACSNPMKGEAYLRAFLNSGIKSMPLFSFNKNEQDELLAFLREVDQTGQYPLSVDSIGTMGWVEIPSKRGK